MNNQNQSGLNKLGHMTITDNETCISEFEFEIERLNFCDLNMNLNSTHGLP